MLRKLPGTVGPREQSVMVNGLHEGMKGRWSSSQPQPHGQSLVRRLCSVGSVLSPRLSSLSSGKGGFLQGVKVPNMLIQVGHCELS